MLINMTALVIINEFDNIMGKVFMMHLTCFHREIIQSDDFLVFDGVEQWHYENAYYNCMLMIVDFCVFSAVTLPVHYYQCQDFDQFYQEEYLNGKFVGYRPGMLYMILNLIYWVSKFLFSIYLSAPMVILYTRCICCRKKLQQETIDNQEELQDFSKKSFQEKSDEKLNLQANNFEVS